MISKELFNQSSFFLTQIALLSQLPFKKKILSTIQLQLSKHSFVSLASISK